MFFEHRDCVNCSHSPQVYQDAISSAGLACAAWHRCAVTLWTEERAALTSARPFIRQGLPNLHHIQFRARFWLGAVIPKGL